MRLIKIFVGWVCWPCLVPCKKAMLEWYYYVAHCWPRVFPVHKVRECLSCHIMMVLVVSRFWSRGGEGGHSLLSCDVASVAAPHLSYVTTFTVSSGTIWHYDTSDTLTGWHVLILLWWPTLASWCPDELRLNTAMCSLLYLMVWCSTQ